MTRTMWYCFLVGVLAVVCAGPMASGQEEKDELPGLQELIAGVTPSMVLVEMTLQYHNGEAPVAEYMGMGYRHAERDFEADWATFIKEERPDQRMGFVLAPDRVVVSDPLVHPRFVERIVVRVGDRVIGATPESYCIEQNAMLLLLDEPLEGVEALVFDVDAEGPYTEVYGRYGNGRWWYTGGEISGALHWSVGGEALHSAMWPSVIVGADGSPISLCFDGSLEADESWKVSLSDWNWLSASDIDARIERVGEAADAGLPRVEMRFRSPSSSAAMSGRRGGGADLTEWNGTGVLLNERGVLVLCQLEPKLTGRLEAVRVHLADGRVMEAEFVASLREYTGMIVELGESVEGALPIVDVSFHDLEDGLLLRSEVRVLGETRTTYGSRVRLAQGIEGFRGGVFPVVGDVSSRDFETGDGESLPMTFVLSLDGELVGLPMHRRESVATRDGYGGRSRAEYEGIVATTDLLLSVLDMGEDGFDRENRPLSEEDENRLAWLGVELQAMDPDLARFNNVVDITNGGSSGGIVTYIYADSPAEREGLEVGDILLRLHIDGQPRPLEVQVSPYDMGWGEQYLEVLDSVEPEMFEQAPPPWGGAETALTRALTDVGFGTPYTIEVFRGGEILQPGFEVEEGPAHYGAATKYKSEAAGLTVKNLTYEARRFFQLGAEDAGVIVSKVEQGEGAAVAGLKPFELIVAVNDEPVYTAKGFEEAIAVGGELKLSIMRMHLGRLVKIRVADGE